MKNIYILTLVSLFILSCSSKVVNEKSVVTVNSDLYPNQLSRAQYYEKMAKAYAEEGLKQKAIDTYRLSLLHDPENLSAHLGLAESYRKIGKYHLAINELEYILKKEPKNKAALLQLGDLYLNAQIFSKAKTVFADLLKVDDKYDEARWSLFYISKLERNYEAAFEAINKISETAQNQNQLLYEKAILLRQLGRLDDYDKLIDQMYEKSPQDKRIVLEKKNSLFKKNNFADATTVLKRYTETHDFDLDISENIVFSAVRSEQFDLAVNELDKQKNWVKDVNLVQLKKAHIYFLDNRLVEAQKLYENVLAKKSENDEARFYLSQIYLATNKLTEAKTTLSGLPSSSDYYADAQVRLAYFEKQSEGLDAALNRVRAANEVRPDQLSLYKAYSDFLIENKSYVESVALLEKGIAQFPNDEDLRVKVAFVHYRLGNFKAFKKNISKALLINPESAEIYSYLTELWFLKKKNPKELEFFATKALEYKSKNTNIKPLLAWALMSQEKSSEAVALFEKFYEENPQQPFYAEALSKVYESADVSMKSAQMGQVAVRLQSQNSLKTSLILDSENKSSDSNQPILDPVRLPASLESQ